MTIIIGAIHDGGAYVGADTLWTWSNNFVREMKTSKFLPLPEDCDLLVASSGEERLSQIFTELLMSRSNSHLLNIEDKADVIALAKELKDEVQESGVGSAKENEMPDHNMGFLVVRKGIPKIWLIESDYAVIEFDDYVCLGSGSDLGEGAMRALAKANVFGKKAVKLALETVCELHPYCGGKLEIQSVSVEEEIVEKASKKSKKTNTE